MPTCTRDIRQLLQTAYSSNASDLHISVGSPPVIRRDGTLRPLEGEVVLAEEAQVMAETLLGSERSEAIGSLGEVDFSYSLDSGVRFRVNVYRQRGEISIAARAIPAEIPRDRKSVV